MARGAGPERDVGVAGRVYDPLGEDRLPAGLALGHHSLDETVLDDRLGDETVQQRLDPGIQDHAVGDDLEQLGVEREALRLHVGSGASDLLGPALELAADPLEVDGVLTAVPRDGVHTDLGDDSAEAAVAVDQRGLRAGTGGGEGGGEATGPAAHHEDLGLMHDRRRPGRLRDVRHEALPWRVWRPTCARRPGRRS